MTLKISTEEKYMKSGAPPVGLWIRLGLAELAAPAPALEHDLKKIFYVINASPYEKNMHALEITGQAIAQFPQRAATLFTLAQQNGIATIGRGDWALAQKAGADGVLVEDITALPLAREAFGEDGIVGVMCDSQKKAAVAHDASVDFISLGTGKSDSFPSLEVLRFWVILSDKPALIEGPITNDNAGFFVKAGATFLDSAEYIFTHKKGVMQGTVNLLHAIDLALADQSDQKVAQS